MLDRGVFLLNPHPFSHRSGEFSIFESEKKHGGWKLAILTRHAINSPGIFISISIKSLNINRVFIYPNT